LSIFLADTDLKEQIDKQRLVRNSALLVSAEAISKLTALLIQVIAARHLGSKGYGMFSYAFVGTGIVLNFIDHGLRVYTTREVSNDFTQAKSVLKNIIFLKKIITIISIVLISIAYTVIPLDLEDLQVIVLISIAMILDGYSEINLGVFRALEKMKEVSILMISQRVLFFVVGGLGILFFDFGIIYFSLAFLLTTTLFFLISREMVHGFLDKEIFEQKKLHWRSVLESSLPICLVIFFSYIYFRLDVVFIFFLHGKAEAGFYTASFKIIESLTLLIAGIRASLFPLISRDTFHDSRQLSEISREFYRVSLLICVPLSIGIIFISEYLVNTLYGPVYKPTAFILKVMGGSFFLIVLNEFLIFLLLAVKKTQIAIKITFLAAILNFTLNWVLISRWGTLGATVSFAFTQVFIFCLAHTTLKKSLDLTLPIVNTIWKPLLASIVMILGIILFEAHIIFEMMFGGCLYIVSLILLKAFNEKDTLLLLDFIIPNFSHKKKSGIIKSEPKNIVLIKLGARGDLILASPFFKNLKQHYPEAFIKLLTGKDSFDAIKTNPYINEFILVNDKNIYTGNIFKKFMEVLRILNKLWSEPIDIIFILHRAWQFNILSLLSGAPYRVGFKRGIESLGLTNVCSDVNIQNETKSYLDLLRSVNIPIKDHETFYNINEGDKDYVSNFLNHYKTSSSHRPLLAIIPGGGKNIASGDRAIKRWPVNRYIELSKRFIDNYGGKVFLIGGVEDNKLIDSIILELPSCIRITHFTLGKAAALIDSCDLVIGNDCGPIHISNALKKPTISIFGPTDPRQWASLKENNIIVQNKIPCSPCYSDGLFPNCEHKTCLNIISVEQIYKHLQGFLRKFSNTGNMKSMEMENEPFLATAPPYGPYLDYVWYKNNEK